MQFFHAEFAPRSRVTVWTSSSAASCSCSPALGGHISRRPRAAAVAAIALKNPAAHRDTVHHLTEPAALTMGEVAQVLTTQLDYPVGLDPVWWTQGQAACAV